MDRPLPTLALVRAWQVGERWYYAENEELAPAESSRARLVELDGERVLCVEVSGTYGVNVWGAGNVAPSIFGFTELALFLVGWGPSHSLIAPFCQAGAWVGALAYFWWSVGWNLREGR